MFKNTNNNLHSTKTNLLVQTRFLSHISIPNFASSSPHPLLHR